MQTTQRFLLCLAGVLAVGYDLYTTDRIDQLEARLQQEQWLARHPAPAPQPTYAFDDSFLQHFGQRGVAIVEGAIRRGITDPAGIQHEFRQERLLRYEIR